MSNLTIFYNDGHPTYVYPESGPKQDLSTRTFYYISIYLDKSYPHTLDFSSLGNGSCQKITIYGANKELHRFIKYPKEITKFKSCGNIIKGYSRQNWVPLEPIFDNTKPKINAKYWILFHRVKLSSTSLDYLYNRFSNLLLTENYVITEVNNDKNCTLASELLSSVAYSNTNWNILADTPEIPLELYLLLPRKHPITYYTEKPIFVGNNTYLHKPIVTLGVDKEIKYPASCDNLDSELCRHITEIDSTPVNLSYYSDMTNLHKISIPLSVADLQNTYDLSMFLSLKVVRLVSKVSEDDIQNSSLKIIVAHPVKIVSNSGKLNIVDLVIINPGGYSTIENQLLWRDGRIVPYGGCSEYKYFPCTLTINGYIKLKTMSNMGNYYEYRKSIEYSNSIIV